MRATIQVAIYFIGNASCQFVKYVRKKEIRWQKNLVGIINLSLHEISLARQFLLDIFEGGRISTNSPLS